MASRVVTGYETAPLIDIADDAAHVVKRTLCGKEARTECGASSEHGCAGDCVLRKCRKIRITVTVENIR